MREALRDVRYAVRTLGRTPGFTLVALVTLAVGIGASTTIFTVVNTVLLRPLPFPRPDGLIMLQPTSGSRVSAAYLDEWRRRSRTLADVAGWYDVRANLTGLGEPVHVHVDRTTTNFFRVLGSSPRLGRTFTATTDLGRVEAEAVLSYRFWQQQYGSAPEVVGQRVTVDGQTCTVIGVMPPEFVVRTNELAESRADVWIPFALAPGTPSGMGGELNVIARLRPGVSAGQARADLSAIHDRLEQQDPSYSRDWGINAMPLLDATVKDIRPVLLLLFGGVGLLLLISCLNVTNLVLLRGARRDQEWATRLALGATRRQIVRQLLIEACVLAAAAGTIALLVSAWAVKGLIAAVPDGLELPRARMVGADARVVLFALVITVTFAVVCGLVSSLTAIRFGSRRTIGTRDAARLAGWGGVANTLIVSEVAVSLVLAAGAALLARSVWSLTQVDPGFRSERVVTLRTTLPADKYASDDRVRTFGQALMNRIEGLPGVRAAGMVNYLPMSAFGAGIMFDIEGRPAARIEDQKFSWSTVIGGRFFDAMGIPIVRGRVPGNDDWTMTRPVVVIDEKLAGQYWANADPVGSHISAELNGKTVIAEIIGVVGSVRWQTTSQPPPAMIYWWFASLPARDLSIVVRATGNASALIGPIRSQVSIADPDQPVSDVRAMDAIVEADLARPRFTLLLLGTFAAAALMLTAVGLYGLIAFAVNQRRPEIGVRLALGAQVSDVVVMFLRRGAVLVTVGVIAGLMGEVVVERFVARLLYGVRASDPATWFAAVALVAAIAMLASYLPARRASRIDPMIALKAD